MSDNPLKVGFKLHDLSCIPVPNSSLVLGGYPLLAHDNHDPFDFDDIFGNAETLMRELKEAKYFSMLYGLDENEIRHMIDTCNFSRIIPRTISHFPKILRKYIPKYVSSFLNTPNEDSGKLVFGLNDYGMTTGVIIKNTDTAATIKKMICSILETKLIDFNCSDDLNYNMNSADVGKKRSILKSLVNMISVTIHDIDTDDHYMDDNSAEIFESTKLKLDDYCQNELEYNKEMVEHIKRVERYKQSIKSSLNDSSLIWEIIDFCCDHVPDDCIGTNGIASDLEDVRESVILQLHGHMNGYITIKYIRGQFSNEKLDYHNVTYWIAMYRDHVIKQLMKIKPKKKNFSGRPKPYRDSMIGNTVQKLLRCHGDEFRICIVEIDIPAGNVLKQFFNNGIKNGTKIYYKYNDVPRATQRMIKDDGEPCCM